MPSKKPQHWWEALNADDVREAFDEATVDAYGDEVVSGLTEMAIQELDVPFHGRVLGQEVRIMQVVSASTTHNDIDMVCEFGGEKFPIAARSIELPKPLPDGHLFLAALFDYQSRL